MTALSPFPLGVLGPGPTQLGVPVVYAGTTPESLGPALGLDLQTQGTGAGSASNVSAFFNLKITSDNIAQLTNTPGSPQGLMGFGTVNAFQIEHHYGGSNLQGVRNTMFINGLFDGGPTSPSNTNRFYVPLQVQWIGSSGDGGSVGNYKGGGIAAGFVSEFNGTYFATVNAAEFDTIVNTNAHVSYVSGIQVCGQLWSNGETYDAAVAVSGFGTGHLGFKTGFLIGDMNGQAALASTSTLMQVINHAALAKGFDFSNTDFTGYLLKTKSGFEIDAPAGDHIIEFGRRDGVASTPTIHFHSGATATGYDAAILASGGDGVSGQAVLEAITAQFQIQGQVTGFPALVVNAASGQTAALVTLGVNGGTTYSFGTAALTFADAINFIVGSTTGTKIGTATTQKLGFFNATPVVQPNGTGNTHTVAAGATTNVFTNTTFDGSTGSTAYTVGDVVKALKALGLLAA